ncbi:DUF1799 domain-containing protein [Algihabitans albus]|uniref:DUF1799 domain-containing protein n=1 Tax=Algihabitans albus TaxID=2164067 RepID=UPI0013C36C15|nr:DUF1799 domain-containing protein [Algihabitans albus]
MGVETPRPRRPAADPEILEQLRALGAPPEAIAARRSAPAPPPAEPVEIWADHWEAFRWFRACASQWRYAGETAVPLGLDYGGAETAARLAGIEPTRQRFAQLRTLEAAALEALLERRRERRA